MKAVTQAHQVTSSMTAVGGKLALRLSKTPGQHDLDPDLIDRLEATFTEARFAKGVHRVCRYVQAAEKFVVLDVIVDRSIPVGIIQREAGELINWAFSKHKEPDVAAAGVAV